MAVRVDMRSVLRLGLALLLVAAVVSSVCVALFPATAMAGEHSCGGCCASRLEASAACCSYEAPPAPQAEMTPALRVSAIDACRVACVEHASTSTGPRTSSAGPPAPRPLRI